MQPGDLVTSADAPEGAPTWVGEVVATTAGAFGDVSIRMLGSSTDWARAPVTIRPLTDAEAVGLAEMLSGGWWEPFAGETHSVLGVGAEAVILMTAPHQWRCLPVDGVEIVGAATSIEVGKVSASRALILYTIRGQP